MWQGLAQKNRTNPSLKRFLVGYRQGVSKKIYKDDKTVFTNLSGRPPPDLINGYFIGLDLILISIFRQHQIVCRDLIADFFQTIQPFFGNFRTVIV